MPTTLVEMFDDLVKSDSDEMNFELKRDPEPNRTFSSEGLDDLMASIQTFIGARISHHFGKTEPGQPGPSRLSVKIQVGVDGKAWQVVPEDIRPWYSTVDGDHRKGGLH